MSFNTYSINESYGPRDGLEGPFNYGGGRTLYYDPKEGKYWDPKTDHYVDDEEIYLLNGMVADKLTGKKND